MGKVQIKLPPWIAAALGAGASDWLVLEIEIKKGATVDRLLNELVASYPGFRERVFNPDTGHLNEQLNVVLNGTLLTFREITKKKLAPGDNITLVPLYSGG